MICCIALFYLAFAIQDAPARPQDPDAVYAQREHLPSARAAAAIWAERLAAAPAATDFENAWKLARAAYWLGGHEDSRPARRAALEQGIAAARAAIAAQPARPEGHFWLAANMGALAESHGLRMGLRYRGPIKDALETVIRIDRPFQHGSADRALGRWYYRVPRLFGGSKAKSEEHLRRSLTYNPNSHASLYFLAETLHAMGRDAEARATLERLLAAPIDPGWAPEDRDFKTKASVLIEALP